MHAHYRNRAALAALSRWRPPGHQPVEFPQVARLLLVLRLVAEVGGQQEVDRGVLAPVTLQGLEAGKRQVAGLVPGPPGAGADVGEQAFPHPHPPHLPAPEPGNPAPVHQVGEADPGAAAEQDAGLPPVEVAAVARVRGRGARHGRPTRRA